MWIFQSLFYVLNLNLKNPIYKFGNFDLHVAYYVILSKQNDNYCITMKGTQNHVIYLQRGLTSEVFNVLFSLVRFSS